MDIYNLHKKFIECNQKISTDTRTLAPDSIFFAWKGSKHDGNVHAEHALEQGAKYAVVDNPKYAVDSRYILVSDGIKALQELARYHREQFDIPVIAIAGSNGKTTTKELAARILSTQKDTVASFGSENNHTGVPKTLLRIRQTTDIAIIEFGANHLGEIRNLCHIAKPTHGLITNLGRDHIGYFGSESAIIEANLELYTYLKQTGGTVFVNKNNNLLMRYAKGLQSIIYGENLHNDYGITSLMTNPYVSLVWNHKEIVTSLTGEYNIENINAAIAIGIECSIQGENIAQAISNYEPLVNRSQIYSGKNNTIVIKDFYNANLTSMKLALDNLKKIGEEKDMKTVALMGDMLELGEYSQGEHQTAANYAKEIGINNIVLVGSEFQKIKCDNVTSYPDVDSLISKITEKPYADSIILLKASNGTNFQKLFDEISW